jgi:hypothetical protein
MEKQKNLIIFIFFLVGLDRKPSRLRRVRSIYYGALKKKRRMGVEL